MSFILFILISGIYVFTIVYSYGISHDYKIYRIFSYIIAEYTLLIALSFVWKIYCSEWFRLTQKSIFRPFFERLLYPAITIILITYVGKKDLILSNSILILQIFLFFTLADFDGSIRNKARYFGEKLINKNKHNVDSKILNEESELFKIKGVRLD